MSRNKQDHKAALIEYRQAVQAAVESVIESCTDTEAGVLDEEGLWVAIHEHVDNSPQVTDHDNAIDTLMYSSHATEGLARVPWINGSRKPFPFTLMAHEAFAADITEAVKKFIGRQD